MNGIHADWAALSQWGWPLLIEHLWQSTLFAALAIIAVVLLRHAPARARYAIWLMATLKFLIPAALVRALIGDLTSYLPQAAQPISNSLPSIVEITSPITIPAQEFSQLINNNTLATIGHREYYCLLTLIWLTGIVFILAFWTRRHRQLRQAIRQGEYCWSGREFTAMEAARQQFSIKRPISLLISPLVTEPGVWRSLAPIILLPSQIAEHLDDRELKAVMMHEMAHIKQWDNLVSKLQMLIYTLCWFHPLVWLLDRQLLATREEACDEQVLAQGGTAKIYAASLVKVLRFCLGWRVAGVSSSSGANLSRRIEQIMKSRLNNRVLPQHHLLIGTMASLLLLFSLATNINGISQTAQAAAQSEPSQSEMVDNEWTDSSIRIAQNEQDDTPAPPEPPASPEPPAPPKPSTAPAPSAPPAPPVPPAPAPATSPLPPAPPQAPAPPKGKRSKTPSAPQPSAPRPPVATTPTPPALPATAPTPPARPNKLTPPPAQPAPAAPIKIKKENLVFTLIPLQSPPPPPARPFAEPDPEPASEPASEPDPIAQPLPTPKKLTQSFPRPNSFRMNINVVDFDNY